MWIFGPAKSTSRQPPVTDMCRSTAGAAAAMSKRWRSGLPAIKASSAASTRAGYLVIFEADNRAAAEALVHSSPIRDAGLYSEYHLFEYQNEVG